MILPGDILKTSLALKDQWFDLKGAAIYTPWGESTLRMHIREGSLPACKVKGKILIKRSELDRWIESHRISGPDLKGHVQEIMDNLKIGESDDSSGGQKR